MVREDLSQLVTALLDVDERFCGIARLLRLEKGLEIELSILLTKFLLHVYFVICMPDRIKQAVLILKNDPYLSKGPSSSFLRFPQMIYLTLVLYSSVFLRITWFVFLFRILIYVIVFDFKI